MRYDLLSKTINQIIYLYIGKADYVIKLDIVTNSKNALTAFFVTNIGEEGYGGFTRQFT